MKAARFLGWAALLVLMAGIGAMLAGCGKKQVPAAPSGTIRYGGAGDWAAEVQAEVQDVVTANGTRCVVLVGVNKGAISCDWNTAR